MPTTVDLLPYGDPDEDFRFIVACDSTIPITVSSFALRFIFKGPYNRPDVGPTTLVDATAPPNLTISDATKKEITCLVSGLTLASGEYHGVLKRTDPGGRATYSRWRLQVEADPTG